MKCAHCGAALIDGIGSCYRCGLPARAARVQAWADLDDAPFTMPRVAAPSPTPARTRTGPHGAARQATPSGVPPTSLRVAGWLAIALAALGLLDVLLGDDPIVVPFALLHALAGVALLRHKRGAWSAAVALGALDSLFAFVGLANGVFVSSLVVAACAGSMLRAIWQPATRAALRGAATRKKRRGAQKAAPGAGATLIRPA